jgi:RNA polymerase sigma-70 factor, ECF subfamily
MAAEPDFDEFYRATARRVLRYVFAMTGDLYLAQDITQEAYARAWRRWSAVSGYDSPESWIRLVANRLATDSWRRRAATRRYEAAAGSPHSVPPPSETSVVLLDALRHLPKRQRHVMCLHYLLDLPVAEIAVEIGIAEGTVKSMLSRGRSALAQILGSPNSSEFSGDSSVQ